MVSVNRGVMGRASEAERLECPPHQYSHHITSPLHDTTDAAPAFPAQAYVDLGMPRLQPYIQSGGSGG